MNKLYQFVYGPLQSRRQGCALGVDVFRKKICSFDCVYCEVGKTETLEWEKNHFGTTEEVLQEVLDAIVRVSGIEVVCFAGMGEPTMHKELGAMICQIKSSSTIPVSVITNGAHMGQERVVQALLAADRVLPSLNSARQNSYDQINRPLSRINVAKVVEDLAAFKRQYKGEMWLEVFIVPELNDSVEDIDCLARAIATIAPDKVQLNTLQRPGTEEWVKPVSQVNLQEIARQFGTNTEVIANGLVNLS